MKSVFSPDVQSKDIESRIISALERISEAFRILLWGESSKTQLSPIQIQILIFLYFHEADKRKVTYISEEFSLSKATVSDSVNTLVRKKLVTKLKDKTDNRACILKLTSRGSKLADKLSLFANRLKEPVKGMSVTEKEELYSGLIKIIRNLLDAGIITVHRMCYSCRFYEIRENTGSYCNLLKMSLEKSAIRIDCPDHEPKAA
ncbi:MAG: MarR family winged helix-turn-helix transcriptional regulator [Ignavibacteria bacterium]|nr:MarR family winged helix-turn-helix transcriptional regulator [Ignavibacteria bacterium]